MTEKEIKPKMVDGEAVCSKNCPRYGIEPCMGLVDLSSCAPYYRARVAELEAQISRISDTIYRGAPLSWAKAEFHEVVSAWELDLCIALNLCGFRDALEHIKAKKDSE